MKKTTLLFIISLAITACQNQTNTDKKINSEDVAVRLKNDSIHKADSIILQNNPGGKFIFIKGKKQFILLKGVGSPAIIFVNGKGNDHSSFDSVQKNLSKITLTFSYDRGGLGNSEPINKERSLDNLSNELNEILEIEKIKPPYLLVGHSMGGYIIRYFQNKYTEKVAGMIFIDAAHEDCVKQWRASRTDSKKIQLDSFIVILKNNPARSAGSNAESKHFWTTDEDFVRDKPIPNNIPVTVLTSSQYNSDPKALIFTKTDQDIWIALHKSWKKQAPQIKHIITNKSGHFIQQDEPEMVTKEILLILNAIKKTKK